MGEDNSKAKKSAIKYRAAQSKDGRGFEVIVSK